MFNPSKSASITKRLLSVLLAAVVFGASAAVRPVVANASGYNEDNGLIDFVIDTVAKYNPIKLAGAIADEYKKSGLSVETAKNLATQYISNLGVSVDAFANSLKNELYTPGSVWATKDRQTWQELMAIYLDDAPRFELIINDPNFSVNYNIDLTPYDYHYYTNSNVGSLQPAMSVILFDDFVAQYKPYIYRYDLSGKGFITAKNRDHRYWNVYYSQSNVWSGGSVIWQYQYGVTANTESDIQFVPYNSVSGSSVFQRLKIVAPSGSSRASAVTCRTYDTKSGSLKSNGFIGTFDQYGEAYNVTLTSLPFTMSTEVPMPSTDMVGYTEIVASYYVIWNGEFTTAPPTTEVINNVVNNYYNNVVNNYITNNYPVQTETPAPTPTNAPTQPPTSTTPPTQTAAPTSPPTTPPTQTAAPTSPPTTPPPTETPAPLDIIVDVDLSGLEGLLTTLNTSIVTLNNNVVALDGNIEGYIANMQNQLGHKIDGL